MGTIDSGVRTELQHFPEGVCHADRVSVPLPRLPDKASHQPPDDLSSAVSLFGNTISHHVIKLIERVNFSEDRGGG